MDAAPFASLYALDGAAFAAGKPGVLVFGATRRADGARVAVKVFPLPSPATMPADHKVVADAIADEYAARVRLGEHPHLVSSLGLFWGPAEREGGGGGGGGVESPSPAASAHHGLLAPHALLVMGYAAGKSAEFRLQGGGWGSGSGFGGSGISGGAGATVAAVPSASPSPSPPARLFSPAETVSVAHCIASALAHLHKNGTVHFDVKPSNILFYDGASVPPDARSARLADFGEAAVVKHANRTVSAARGLQKGTEAFMAPEVVFAKTRFKPRPLLGASAASDVWSLGATLLACLTGHLLGANVETRRLWSGAAMDELDDWDRGGFFGSDEVPELVCGSTAERAAWAAAP